MRTLLIGSRGQLGSDFCRIWSGELVALPHEALDVCSREQAFDIVGREAPDLVINTAAYHRVDDCQTSGARAFEVNALGAKNVADASPEPGPAMLFISPDYVFDGEKGGP